MNLQRPHFHADRRQKTRTTAAERYATVLNVLHDCVLHDCVLRVGFCVLRACSRMRMSARGLPMSLCCGCGVAAVARVLCCVLRQQSASHGV